MIFSRFERTVAFRYLRSRRGEGFISVIAGFSLLGIGLGVATLIIVMSVMNGFRAELFARVLGVNSHLAVVAVAGTLADYELLATRIAALPGIVGAAPVVEGQVMVTASNVASGALVRGMRRQDLEKRPLVAGNLRGRGFADWDQENGVILGIRLAGRLGVRAGDQVTLISPQGNATPFGTAPRSRAYRVAALFEAGMYEYDNSYIYMSLAAAQLFFRVPAAATGIEVMVAEPDQVRHFRHGVERLVAPAARVYDWQQTNATFVSALAVERNVMFLILTLIIVVAAFNIISGLIMLVKDKGRDIAILRAMGATRGMIMRIFLLSGASVGIFGTLLGFCLGLAFTYNIETIRQWLQALTGTALFSPEIYFLSRLPAKIDAGEVMTVLSMALGLSLLATLYPSWRAARLDPAEALRHE